jgi:hypothetical protein
MQSAVSAVVVATLYLPGHTSGAAGAVNAWLVGLIGLAVAAAVPGAPVGSRIVMPAASRRQACRCVPPGVAGVVNEP